MIVVGDVRGVITLLDERLATVDVKPTKFRTMKTPKNECYRISEIRFSPDSKKLALGGYGGPSHVEVWEIEAGKLGKSTIISVGFTNSLTHLDWSSDSLFMMATSEGYELKFISYYKMRDVSVSQVKDCNWYTLSCDYGYQVQGICNKNADGLLRSLLKRQRHSFGLAVR
jgi:WD40 repeat protein